MSEIKVNKISPKQTCTQVTLGDSGDIFTIPSGATLTNSGSINNSGTITNTGTISGGTISGTLPGVVDWDTTPKTANFTAVSGEGYFVDTTLGAITVTLPSSPSAGDYVSIKDYANTADTNNITIDRNGSNIQGITNNFIIDTEGLAITLLYSDATQGWISTGAAQASDITEGPTFIVATGGTITCDGDFKIHTFTGPGTFTVSSLGNPQGGPNSIDYLVVAGGGSSGNGASSSPSGGGGAGGYRTSFPSPAGTTPVTVQGYPITVGAGGAAGPSIAPGNNGSPSIFSTITSSGGGYGGRRNVSSGNPGGSGGGAGAVPNTVGTGNTPPVSPPQGNNGGVGDQSSTHYAGGGGGGASGVGTAGVSSTGAAGNGGAGSPNSISGSATFYAGGGGGFTSNPAGTGAVGGAGGGGPGQKGSGSNTPGTANTGGGGGAGSPGASGGSGVVVIRYKFQ
jgi:hypothetical protein